MLDTVLEFFKDELNTFIGARMGSDSVTVKLTRIVDENGKYAFPEESLGLSLVNIEEERVFKDQLPSHTLVNGQHVLQQPELKLNLHALVAANFKLYGEGLKFLSCVLTYFQAHAAFSPEQYPALDPRVGKLAVELQSLSYEQLNQMWAYIGGKHLPSVVYRIRVVVVQDLELQGVGPPLVEINADLHGR